MERYYVNNTPQTNGDHEVHKNGCPWLDLANSTTDLGLHYSCHSAVTKAKLIYFKADGCYHCCNECHTS
jgi:hypothetical protein